MCGHRIENNGKLADSGSDVEYFLGNFHLGCIESAPCSDFVEKDMFLKDIKNEGPLELGDIGMPDYFEVIFREVQPDCGPSLAFCPFLGSLRWWRRFRWFLSKMILNFSQRK